MAGFTLIEILVTLVVLSVGIVGVLMAMDSSMSALRRAREGMWSTILLHEKTTEDEIKIREYGTPPQSGEGSFDAPYSAFSWERSVTAIDVKWDKSDETDSTLKWYSIETAVWQRGTGMRQGVACIVSVPGKPRGIE